MGRDDRIQHTNSIPSILKDAADVPHQAPRIESSNQDFRVLQTNGIEWLAIEIAQGTYLPFDALCIVS